MKKMLLTCLVLGVVSGAVYASVDTGCKGGHSFIQNLNLDQEREEKVQGILSSYREIKDLYKSGNQEQIPDFLAQKEAELSEVLTPEELTQFKQNVGQWAAQKDFSRFMKYSSWGSDTDKEEQH